LFLPDGAASELLSSPPAGLAGPRVQSLKVLDFGIARAGSRHHATSTGTIIGTPEYMAPEQVRGVRELDGRADLYSLGCVLFECLTGQPPFVSEHLMSIFAKVLLEPAPRVSMLRSDVPSALDELIAQLLEKDPERRPARAGLVAEALEQIPLSALSAHELPAVRERAPQALTAVEQRLMSIVFVVMPSVMTGDSAPRVGSAETVSEQSQKLVVDSLRAAAAPFSERVELLPTGALIVVLSGRATATDQAAEGARCALRLRDELPCAHLALCTGRGHITLGAPQAEVLDRAAHLLSEYSAEVTDKVPVQGKAGIILLDEMTRSLCGPRFTLQPVGRFFRLLGEQDVAEPPRLLLGKPAPLVGRERDLAMLESTFLDCRDESSARVVLITGAPGLGKSRLAQELVARVREKEPAVEVWTGRGDNVSANAPYSVIAPALRRAAGIHDGEPIKARISKLRARIRRVAPEDQVARIHEFLCELCGAPLPLGSEQLQLAREQPLLMGDQVQRAVEDFVAAECAIHPVLWIIEDLHWGDLASVKLLDGLLRNLAEKPLMLLSLARPELHQEFPNLWASRSVHEIRLSGLSRKAAERLVREVLPSADTQRIAALIDKAAGNALLLEELLRAAVGAAPESGEVDVPATVVAMVQSRIERLNPQARHVLRAASVLGEIFWSGAVLKLLGGPQRSPQLPDWLRLLTEQELVSPRLQSRFPGEQEFMFRHALVREAAYAMLTESDRQLGHRLAAEFLLAAGESQAATLAVHYERGGEPAQARGYYLRAARESLLGSDFPSVLRYAERASICGASGEEQGESLALRAEANLWRGAYEDAAQLAAEAQGLLVPRSARWFSMLEVQAIARSRRLDYRAVNHLTELLLGLAQEGERSFAFLSAAARTAVQAYISGSFELASRLSMQIEEAMASIPEPSKAAQGLLLMLRSNRALLEQKVEQSSKLLEESAVLFEQAGDLRAACAQRVDASIFYTELGANQRAEQLLTESLRTSERMGLNRLVSVIHNFLAQLLMRTGRLEEALPMAQLANRELASLGDLRMGSNARLTLARIHLAMGMLDQASAELDAGLEAFGKSERFRSRAFALKASLLLRRGQVQEALSYARDASLFFQNNTQLATDALYAHAVYADALIQAGELGAAAVWLQELQRRIDVVLSKVEGAAVKTEYIANLEELKMVRAAQQRLAALLPAAGSPSQAETQL